MLSDKVRRGVRWSVGGFALGYAAVYELSLIDGLTIAHFDALYEMARPVSVLGWIRCQHAFEAAFVAAGLIGSLLGFIASFAQRRGRTVARAT
ncbi:MAG: hypothetical protein JWL95_2043 [Gemmatimonadetes bacterium]|nr:hypothetical protein [Gemmatimonadota bacterium]